MQDKAGIYQIRNLLNSKIYIGSTVNLRKRKNRHFSELNLNCHYNIHLQRAFNKYGKENFVFEVLITCYQNMLVWYEQQFIDEWKPEYNIQEEAGTNLGVKRTPEMKKKVGDFFRGRPISEKHKKNIGLANRFKKPVTSLPSGKYRACMKIKDKQTYLGCFDTPIEAYNAYISKQIELFGEGG